MGWMTSLGNYIYIEGRLKHSKNSKRAREVFIYIYKGILRNIAGEGLAEVSHGLFCSLIVT
jgi:hypothetical protein